MLQENSEQLARIQQSYEERIAALEFEHAASAAQAKKELDHERASHGRDALLASTTIADLQVRVRPQARDVGNVGRCIANTTR
jgi:hypothetical protein